MVHVEPPRYWVHGEPGIQPVSTPRRRLDAAIARADKAYDALHEVLLYVGPEEGYAALSEALETVFRHIDRLTRERDALREEGAR